MPNLSHVISVLELSFASVLFFDNSLEVNLHTRNGTHLKYKSPVVQWLWVPRPKAGGLGLIGGQGSRSHMLRLRPGLAK